MTDPSRTNQELLEEISVLKQKIQELGQVESERKRAEEALAHSHDLMRYIIEHNRSCIAVHDRDLKYIYVSQRYLDDYKVKEKDIIGKHHYDVFPDLPQKWRDVHQKALAGEVSSAEDDPYLREDGTVDWTRWECRPWYEADGSIGGIIIYTEIINERKRTDEALRESEENYRTLIQKIQTAVVVHGPDTRILICNSMAQELLGLTEDQLLGKTAIDPAWHFLNADGTVMRFEEYPVNQVIARHQALRNIIAGVHRPNKEQENDVWVLINADPVFVNDEIVQVIVTFIDITERKLAEEALCKSEEKYRTIIENMEDGYHEVDLKGNFTFFNESMLNILGYEREELLGMNNRQYADEENTRKVYQVYNQVYLTGKPVKNFEWQIIRKDGDRRDIEVSISLIRNTEGDPTGFRGILRDTTDRKRAEEEKQSLVERLQRAEKMESLGVMAGGVAHDLNNVLGIVVGYAEMLLMGTDKSSPIRSKVVNIMEGGQKAATIVGDLLTLARRGVSGREVVNLNKIIADWQQSPEFEKLSSYNLAVKVKTELEPGLPNISASSVHLNKTIFNLVSNASEAMKQGGCVTIKTINQYVDKPIQGYDKIQEGDYVVLSVSDTGEGINAADMKRIFEPFYTKKVMGRSGTGLGLAVVWGTVKDHDGYINVESEEGKGSTFTLYLPVSREELSAETVSVDISEYMGKGESILVVDDVKGQRDLAEEILQKLNYSVTSSSSGEKALSHLKEHKVDLMVLDMIMDPGMDGLDTYKKVLEIHPKQKAIIVSGFSESDRVKAAQALGAGAYVRKPYVIEKLGLAVKKELDRLA
jgi:PAS domain S-box-containing protein